MTEKRFAFGVMTYNQEEIVIETLESIKYQIVHFGKGYIIKLIVTDDASKDNTLSNVERWTKENRSCFCEISIITNTQNVGTVANYNAIMDKIDNECFKIIAGDDLIAPINIFELVSNDKNSFFTFPFYRLENGEISYNEEYLCDYYFKKKHYRMKKNVPWVRYGDFMHTPSTFYSKEMYNRSDAKSYNSKYYLYEDDPTFYAIFKNLEDVKVVFGEAPIILYRYSSTSASTTPNKQFLKDWKKLQENYSADSVGAAKVFYKLRGHADFSKKINLFKVIGKTRRIMRKVIVVLFHGKDYKRFKSNFLSYQPGYADYYEQIIENKRLFLGGLEKCK